MSRKFRSARRATAARGILLLVVAAAALCPATFSRALAAAHRPAAPTHLAATGVTRTAIVLSWKRSTGPGRIVNYRVYRNGRKIGHTGKARFAVAGLRCGTAAVYTVRAVNAAGGTSLPARRTLGTAACTARDTEPPSAPTGLSQSEPAEIGFDLTWLPSTDNVRVAGYRVSRNGAPVARTAETSIAVGGLVCGTSYTITVEAYDAAGNLSAPATLTAATAACTPPASCDGVAVAPGADLAALAAAKPSGTTFCIAPGSYRLLSAVRPRDGQQFIGTGPGVDITGGVALTNFVGSGGVWLAAGPTVAAYEDGSGFTGFLQPQSPYANDVTMDGVLLNKVGVRVGGKIYGDPPSAVVPGSYFVDYDAGRVELGSDPSGHDVEIGQAAEGFASPASGVALRNLNLDLFTSTGVHMLPGASTWTLDDVSVSTAHDSGVKLADNAVMTGGVLAWNGRYGLNARGSNVTIDGVDVSHSDAAQYRDASGDCVAAGGSKFVGTVGLVLRNSVFHDNTCNGIWLDVDTYDSTIENNTSIDNQDDGIRVEVSHKVAVSGNTVKGNGGWGIYVSNSAVGDVSQNTVGGNSNGAIVLNWSGRTTPTSTHGSYATSDVDVHDNTMILTASDQIVGIVDKTGTGYAYTAAAGNHYRANHYVLPNSASRYFRLDVKLTWSAWRTAGMDPEYPLM